jgi:L-2-hydroxyglutarate oxidase LhgO
MPDLDVTIIGGGIVGCAVAAESVSRGLTTVLLEREPALARGITSRNSEVAHGGMYYPEGSAKARLCLRGRRLLKAFCEANGIRYRECGKLIVAVSATEVAELERLYALGVANGVEDLSLLDHADIGRLEPEVQAVAALHSPRTAILDAEGAARAYASRARAAGAEIMTASEATGLVPEAGGWRVSVQPPAGSGRQGWSHTSRWVVNAAGLYSDRIASLAGVDVDARGWRLGWVKGNYFTISPRHDGRVSRLIYPVPPADGSSLGIHLCLDLAGQMRLGPDVETLSSRPREDYTVDPRRAGAFFASASTFLPFLEFEDLAPGTCGLRPRFERTTPDFVLQRETGDLAGLINLVGIESPGLTAAPAIAEQVGAWLTS